MALSNQDRTAIREIVTDIVQPLCVKVDGINQRLDQLNGKTNHHSQQINEALEWRAKKYTQIDQKFEAYDECMHDVEKLLEENISNKAMKKFNAKAFAISTTIITIVIAIIGLWLHATMG